MAKETVRKKNKKRPIAKKHVFLNGEFNLPELEEEVLKFWDERNIFEKSVAKNKAKTTTAKQKNFVFYEGPPTANGRPGVHHILSRSFKDIIPRFKTMQGFYVPRKAGWDTHGLPVELQVEKQLGIKSKKEIDSYGIAAFNAKCRESVWEFKDEWERLTKRMGYWIDLKNPYITYETDYMETLWWIIAQLSKKKILYKGHRVVPWCTRCGTSLSSHELAQGYKEVTDKSVFVKFKLKAGQKIGNFTVDNNTYILSWTTTPWTLPGNVALAVGKEIDYQLSQVSMEEADPQGRVNNGDILIMAVGTEVGVLENAGFAQGGITIKNRATVKGNDLLGLEYEPLFDISPLKSDLSYKIYPADFVTTTDGTGVVHTAVMYGEDDYELGKKIGLPQHHTVNSEGKFTKDVVGFEGKYVKAKDTEQQIFDYLKEQGTLFRVQEYKHEYPFCWRCGTAILYYARTSWFVAMSKLRKELLARNETVHWAPEHIKEGRFGEWLREVKDWNFSRERYWGTPLPIWECRSCHHTEVIASVDDLSKHATPSSNHYWAMRHGQSKSNVGKLIDSLGEAQLTPTGRKQVEKSARSLLPKKIDLIFASDFVRTKESAEIAAKILGIKNIVFDKRLHEIYLASLSGKPVQGYWDLMGEQKDQFGARVVPHAESWTDVRARAWSFVKELEETYSGKNILIVSHEDTIWMIAQAALGWSDRKAEELKLGNKNHLFLDNAGILPFNVKSVSRDETGKVDLHRPFIDSVILPCPSCKAEMKRVPEIADVWFDSGSMPYAQMHFPFAQVERESGAIKDINSINEAAALKQIPFPADYIAEGVDQTRGWFYTLLAVATALGYEAPYKNVICLGHINDKYGQKMSKSKGNVVDPWVVMSTYGVDAVRWYFYTATPPSETKNFDEQEIAKVFRKTHLIVYNSLIFWKTYAKQNAKMMNQTAASNILDRWIVAQLNELIEVVTKRLEAYQVREAGLAIESFVDDLSRWYIRRSRKRLQRPESPEDYAAASATLGFVLLQLVKLMAPFTPFFAEILYSSLNGTQESVHLDEWPAGNNRVTPKDKALPAQMKLVRELGALGLAKRAEVGIKVRQPLAELRIASRELAKEKELLQILADEVNVKKVSLDATLKEGVALDTVISGELREEGLLRDVLRMGQELRQKAGLSPKDKIALMLQLPNEIQDAVMKNEKILKSDVGAKTIEYKKSEKFTAEEITKLEGREIWIGLRKI